jgi:hypothetical protein
MSVQSAYDYLAAQLEERRRVAQKATPGPWWFDEDDQCWRLHGIAMVISEQVVNKQILKAPKIGTPYAEYWPDDADAAFLISNDPANVILMTESSLRILAEHKPIQLGLVMAWCCGVCVERGMGLTLPCAWPCNVVLGIATPYALQDDFPEELK